MTFYSNHYVCHRHPFTTLKVVFNVHYLSRLQLNASVLSDDTAQRPNVDLGVCVGVTFRVLTTCRLALSWCTMKIQHLLSSWSVHQFLFLTHSDLKVPLHVKLLFLHIMISGYHYMSSCFMSTCCSYTLISRYHYM